MAARKQPARPTKARASTPRKITRSTKTRAFIPQNVTIRKAENGFTINAWDEKNNKDVTVIAKTKAELNRELTKFGIK